MRKNLRGLAYRRTVKNIAKNKERLGKLKRSIEHAKVFLEKEIKSNA